MNWSIPIWLGVAQTCWAFSYIAMKYASAELPVCDVVFLRYGIVSVIFLIYWLFRRPPKFSTKDALLMGGVGVLDFFVAQMLQVTALHHTQAIDASIMIMFEPLFTILLAALFVRERPSKKTWVTLSLGMVGILFLSKGTFTAGSGISPDRILGNLLFLSSLLCEATYSAAGAVYAKRYGPIHAVAWMMMCGFVVGSIVNFPTIHELPFLMLSARVWMSILFLAVGCSVFCYSLWYWVIRRASVQQAAVSLFLQPLIGSLFGYVLLGESIGFGTLLGAGLIISSLIWWQLRS